MKIQEALEQLRKEEKRKFAQTVDLIVNLRGIDPKKETVNVVVTVPHLIKEKKVCAFLKEKSNSIPTITEVEFAKYKEKKEVKHLVKNYDYFIAIAPLMPKVATVFGKILGPAGKMPSPQLGIINQENDKEIKSMVEKISKSAKIRVKEASVKIAIGKETMSNQEIEDNVKAIYKAIENALPKKKENIRSVMLKLTMTHPVKVEIE